MLSDIIKPESEDSNKKEVKFKEEPKQEEKGKLDEDKKKLRLSKRLAQAKKLRQSMEEKNKHVKSEAIMQKAEALEKKLPQNK